MKSKNSLGLKLIAGVALAFLVIECIVLVSYFFNPKKEAIKPLVVEKTDSLQNKVSVKETDVKANASQKDSINPSQKKNVQTKQTPELETNTEKLDDGILHYEQLNDQISKVNYFIENLLPSRKTICNKGENNKEKYKAALITTYANLIKVIPAQTKSDYAQLCNVRNDLEYAMKKLNCTIDPAIQKKLKEKC